MIKKLIVIVCISLLILTTFCGCPNPFLTLPLYQPGTTWSTDDGKVHFYVDERQSDPILGYIETTDGPVAVAIYMSKNVTTISVAYADDILELEEGECVPAFELWHCDYHRDSFVATVSASKYFEVGQELRFYRK